MARYSYLEPDILARFLHRKLTVGRVSGTRNPGLHASTCRGGGVTFLQHKEYTPGDDLKSVDWRLSARRDRVYVREFENETAFSVLLLLDASASMGYCSDAANHAKFSYAKRLVSHLGAFFLNQRDRVRFLNLGHETRHHTRPEAPLVTPGQLVERLVPLRASGAFPLPRAVRNAYAGSDGASGLLFLFSDFIDQFFLQDEPRAFFDPGKKQLVLVRVNDPAEITFPFHRFRRFRDPETEAQLLADPSRVRTEYRDAFARHTADLIAFCRRYGARFIPVDTALPLETALDRILQAAGVR